MNDLAPMKNCPGVQISSRDTGTKNDFALIEYDPVTGHNFDTVNSLKPNDYHLYVNYKVRQRLGMIDRGKGD